MAFSFVIEAMVIALIGGLIGCLAVLPVNGVTTSTLNMQTFSHLAFAFRITPVLLVIGVLFALLMGLVGGVPPAIRALVGSATGGSRGRARTYHQMEYLPYPGTTTSASR